MVVAMVGAIRLARRNRGDVEELRQRHEALTQDTARENALQAEVRTRVYDDVLVRFKRGFDKLRNADLAELCLDDRVAGTDLPQTELAAVRVSAVQSLAGIALSSGVSAAAGVGTFSIVSTVAVASTGTAISTLSGAAATSATLAALGGGAISAGGGGISAGTTVMTGIVAAPVLIGGVVVMEWQGRKARRTQQETQATITTQAASFTTAESGARAAIASSTRVREVLADLQAGAMPLLEQFEALLERSTDYAGYSTDHRGVVARLAALAVATAAVMAAPLSAQDDDRVAFEAAMRSASAAASTGAAAAA